jgi:hypothetical protein
VKAFYELLDRMFAAVAKRSGRVVAVVALLLYAGVGLALPLVFVWPPLWLIAANVVGTSMAVSLILTWLGFRLQERDRRHLVEWTTDLRLLNAEEFEWFVGEIFRREGWHVEEVGRQDAPDGNIDLRLVKGREQRLIQCKRWTSRLVGVDEIRIFAGTLARERMSGTAGILVTLAGFTEQARQEAHVTGLTLLHSRDLYSRVERVRQTEPCPNCQEPMVLDRSSRGWWFRCVAPGCSGKRDLGRDPVRAVELLTELR